MALADHQVFAYHSYCLNNASGAPTPVFLCRELVDAAWNAVNESLAHIGIGGFLTEFGAVGNDSDSMELLQWQCDGADALLQSWTYWTFKS